MKTFGRRISGATLVAFAAVIAAVGFASKLPAAEPTADELMTQAQAAQVKGERVEALTLAHRAIALAPKNPQCYYVRGTLYTGNGQHDKAVADYDEALKLEPRGALVYQLRGLEHFKLGHVEQSIADFDKYLAYMTNSAPHHWQRGIALYYAGRFEDGRRQFELHQTVNPNDVENAVWHFLCVARASGVEKARTALIPIKGDTRVPMAQIHSLFAGKARPDDVLAAASAGNPPPARLRDHLFYAHLYLGLYFEALGDDKKARDHIFKADTDYRSDHYMGDVARVHAEMLRKAKK